MALFSGRLGFSGPDGDAFPAEMEQLERGSSNTNLFTDYCWHYPTSYDRRLLDL
ncbi:hypothetical protein PR003_g15629 [Phytophthora rubi]|uniref:Uncharacterized protein n=1 Tax=Phytophthora rubi TaxID=129364 RepID=A0A6A4EXW4_9STRA|nr:hypothetical protein PR003_g15629 [Phytophthora rubi]